jgi:hypothetical protein
VVPFLGPNPVRSSTNFCFEWHIDHHHNHNHASTLRYLKYQGSLRRQMDLCFEGTLLWGRERHGKVEWVKT